MLELSTYNLLLYFVIYSFLGWILEVSYAFYSQHKFVNRGFLNGPFCPIYGSGSLILIIFLNSFKNNLMLLFIFSILLTSFLEYITGYVLETVFNTRWWDYDDNAYNIKGRVCLSFSMMWGAVAVFIIKFVHPYIEIFTNKIPVIHEKILFYSFTTYFIVDLTVTIISLIEFRKIIIQLEQLSKEIKEKYSYFLEKTDVIEVPIKELKIKYDNAITSIKINHKRLLSAFPNLMSKSFDNLIKEIQNKLKLKR
ncbi:membrane protein [Clostridium putrefaciens]|uniref:Membrane protein n=1 Tax=Clostridium putrefaciens TaxID=99675 RepID=A0A381J6E1_9CLOT|nr:putative ABC transporter permease [Clostridium putrefaciens]SUY46854.1 membrane protein [Clostridium putrefaciens]